MDGILLIDKPAGITSFDVVYRIKRKFNLSKVGHTGTLDPFATGLMIILCGQATKLAFLFDNLDKEYQGIITFGNLYDTYDITGNIIGTKQITLTNDIVSKAVLSFNGSYDQVPPKYSAIKINGKKAYDLARKGLDVKITARNVKIYSFKMLSELNDNKFAFSAFVSKGTYIRSLAYDLGLKLDTYGALESLRRIKIGDYLIDDAKLIDDVTGDNLISDTKLFGGIKRLQLSDYLVNLVKNGIYLDQRQIETNEPFIVVDKDDNLIAYYIVDKENTYRPLYFFKG